MVIVVDIVVVVDVGMLLIFMVKGMCSSISYDMFIVNMVMKIFVLLCEIL